MGARGVVRKIKRSCPDGVAAEDAKFIMHERAPGPFLPASSRIPHIDRNHRGGKAVKRRFGFDGEPVDDHLDIDASFFGSNQRVCHLSVRKCIDANMNALIFLIDHLDQLLFQMIVR